MRHVLLDASVRAASPKEGTSIRKLADGDGLQLWVRRKNSRGRPTYVREWHFDYRFCGKRKGLTLRRYPTVSLAVATGRSQTDPTASLSKDAVPALGLLQHKSYAAITDPAVFGGLLRAMEGYDGSAVVRGALKLLALTALRPGELRQLCWSWVD